MVRVFVQYPENGLALRYRKPSFLPLKHPDLSYADQTETSDQTDQEVNAVLIRCISRFRLIRNPSFWMPVNDA